MNSPKTGMIGWLSLYTAGGVGIHDIPSTPICGNNDTHARLSASRRVYGVSAIPRDVTQNNLSELVYVD